MKNYTAEGFVELLKKIDFPNYETYACVNMAYLDFVTKIVDIIDLYCPSKRVRIKGNTKPWFDSEVISLVNERDSCYKKCKVSKLETDKDLLKEAKQIIKATIQRKKGTFFQDKTQENSKNSQGLWKTLTSLGPNSKKMGQSKICLKEDSVIQFEPKKNANIFKKFYSELT